MLGVDEGEVDDDHLDVGNLGDMTAGGEVVGDDGKSSPELRPASKKIDGIRGNEGESVLGTGGNEKRSEGASAGVFIGRGEERNGRISGAHRNW